MRDVDYVRDLAKRRSLGLVNFVTALAYNFCLALPAAFTQTGNHHLAELCTCTAKFEYPAFGLDSGPLWPGKQSAAI